MMKTKLKLKDEEIKDIIKKLQEERQDKSPKAGIKIDTVPLFGSETLKVGNVQQRIREDVVGNFSLNYRILND